MQLKQNSLWIQKHTIRSLLATFIAINLKLFIFSVETTN